MRAATRARWIARHRGHDAPPPSGVSRTVASPVQVHIGALVLHGFARGDRWAIAAAVRAEITHVLGARGVASAMRTRSALPAAPAAAPTLAYDATARMVGVHTARAVYGALAASVR